MRPDYFVPFMSANAIASIATRWREHARLDRKYCFDITEFILEHLSEFYVQKGRLEIIFFHQQSGEPPAYVKYRPLRLFVDREIWNEAKTGEPMARFILAHEIGHILLHDHNAKSFLSDPSLRLKFPMKENSSEWQADTLGGFLLVSDNQVSEFITEKELAINCGLPAELAIEKFAASALKHRKKLILDGEICSKCGHFSVQSHGIKAICSTCGNTSVSAREPTRQEA